MLALSDIVVNFIGKWQLVNEVSTVEFHFVVEYNKCINFYDGMIFDV